MREVSGITAKTEVKAAKVVQPPTQAAPVDQLNSVNDFAQMEEKIQIATEMAQQMRHTFQAVLNNPLIGEGGNRS